MKISEPRSDLAHPDHPSSVPSLNQAGLSDSLILGANNNLDNAATTRETKEQKTTSDEKHDAENGVEGQFIATSIDDVEIDPELLR